MSEEHIKTVVIDRPVEKRADNDNRDESRNEQSDKYESDERKPGLPNSWLS